MNFADFRGRGYAAGEAARRYLAWRLGRRFGECVREPSEVVAMPPSERHLQAVWFDPALRPDGLRTREGDSVVVVHPGEWNTGAGPDFLQAELVIGGHRVRGDVEVHLSPGDWTLHGHGRDERYRQVVAHVTWFGGAVPSSLPFGAASLVLSDFADAGALFDAIDASRYPRAALGGGVKPCRARLGGDVERVFGLLAAAGSWRIQGKAARLGFRLANGEAPERVLYSAVLTALGHVQYTVSFHRLADRVWPCAGESRDSLLAALLGEAGLLPVQVEGLDVETAGMVRRLWDLWFPRSDGPLGAPIPRGRGAVRPANLPWRRLAAGAALLHNPAGFLGGLEGFAIEGRGWFGEVSRWLGMGSSWPFWEQRATLCSRPGRRVALLGKGRIGGLLLNALVPFELARGRFPEALLCELPAEESSSAQMEVAEALLGADGLRDGRLRSGLVQQGLVQIRNDFCSVGGGACACCLVARGEGECNYSR